MKPLQPYFSLLIACTALLTGACIAEAQLPADEFTPVPAIAADARLAPGTTITAANVTEFEDVLDSAVATLIKNGNAELEVGAHINLPIHPNYVAASGEYFGQAKLGPESGDMEDYIAGRPFAGGLSADDPRAGEKAAWNMRYGYGPDESETEKMVWRYKDQADDSEERKIEMYGALMRFKHRHTRDPRPDYDNNPANLYSALYLKVSYPFDIRNTQLLTHTNSNDAEPEQAWIYLNTQRRVKRLGTGQKTDAFLGSDIMIEDFLGYNGRIRDMKWEYLGTDEVLAPLYAFNQLRDDQKTVVDEFTVLDFNGRGKCMPAITWQPRAVVKIKATPRAEDHPIGYRIFTLDAATFAPVLTQIYDRSGKLWKLGMVALSDSSQHFPENAEWQGVVTDAVSMIDMQAQHCTTIEFRTHIPEGGLTPKMFTTQQMRSAGR